MRRVRDWWANPWGKPRFLVLFTALYLTWSIVPDPGRDPILVQRGPVTVDRTGLVAALVHGGSRSFGAPRSRAELGAPAEPAAVSHRGARHRPARRRARDRADAVARPRFGDVASGVAGDARHTGDRDGDGAAPRLRPPADLRPAGHRRAGDRPHHVLARLRRDHRARSPALDRAAVRRGCPRPGRVAAAGRAPRTPADARSRRSSPAGSSSSPSPWTTS